MSQHRLFSTLLSLTALTSTVGFSQASYAADSQPANSTDAAASQLQVAQAAPSSAPSRTLYVTGTGQVSAPADQALVVLSFYPNSYFSDYSDPDAPTQPQVQPNDLTTAVEAATAAGAIDVKATPDLSSPGSMRVRMVLNQPTQAKVEQLLTAVNTAVVKTNRYISSGATVGYTIRDCKALEANARQAAMTDATERANALANVSGTRLGDMVSVSESVSWGSSYSAACPAADDPTIFADLYSMPYYDVAAPAAVRLIYSLSVTYGLE